MVFLDLVSCLKIVGFNQVNLGWIPSGTRMSHWWHQERHWARKCPALQLAHFSP